MRKSLLLDRGREPMTFYPVKAIHDSMGNRKLVPDLANGVTIMVNVSTDRQSTAELVGQVDVEVLSIHTRKAPVGASSWAMIEFRGKTWDLAKPPTKNELTKALSHIELIIRSRNRDVPVEAPL